MRDLYSTTSIGGSVARLASMPFVGKHIRFAPEDGGGSGAGEGGADDVGAASDTQPENLLFPDEGAKEGEAGDRAAEGEGGKKAEGEPEWKPYEDDPAKSKEENDRLRSENDAKKPLTDDEKAAKAHAEGVPEDGKYEFKMPEGIPLDTVMSDKISPILAKHKVSRAAAQELADAMVEAGKAKQASADTDWGKLNKTLMDLSKGDKEFGGENFSKNVVVAQTALKRFGTPELTEYLKGSGGANHPEVIRFMVRVGNAISEDKPANGGGGGSGKPAEAAHILFPNDAPKG